MDDVTAAKILIGCLDLTSLGDHDTEYRIEDLCAKADTPYGHVAAVCIWPQFIPLAKKKLKKTPVKIATVVNFPHGGSDFAKLRHEIRQAFKAGADEIDAVFPYHDFLEGNLDVCDRFLDTVTKPAAKPPPKSFLKPRIGKAPEAEATRLPNKGVGFIVLDRENAGFRHRKRPTSFSKPLPPPDEKPVSKPAAASARLTRQKYLTLAQTVMGSGWISPEHLRIGASSLLDNLQTIKQGY
ncbi:MAG: hypothetical protein ACLSE6_02910 [Alphaproteobacteria bacterium]